MKVCAVIVTYGNRFELLEKSVKSCFRAGINKVIVVDNNSNEQSKSKLRNLEKVYKDKLKVIYLPENLGSAGGYKIGLEEAYRCQECDYILTLDDDNVIPLDALKKIECLLCYLEKYKDNLMLAMYRPIWDWDRKTVQEGWIKSYKPNNFLGFNFWERVLNRLKKIFITKKQPNKDKIFYPLQPAIVTAMGGLFFPKKVIDKIGFPEDEFFLYAEDHEYTYRFTKNGGNIFLCSEIVIEDLDQTHFNKNKSENLHFFHPDFPKEKLYYTIRNHTYLSKQFINNKLFFYGNLIMFCLLQLKYIFKVSRNLFFERYKLFLRAIKDGLDERLGKTF